MALPTDPHRPPEIKVCLQQALTGNIEGHFILAQCQNTALRYTRRAIKQVIAKCL